MKKSLPFFLLIFCLNSCSSQRFILNKNHAAAKKVTYSEEKIFTNWGIGEEQVLYNPQSYCTSNQVLAKIEFKQAYYPLEFITLGYLQPRRIDVYCIDQNWFTTNRQRDTLY